MAKRLLLNILITVLGDYVEGLQEDNLKLGVWTGEIVLEDLKLNSGMLQKLGLPLQIVHGCIRSLKVTIPWATLETNPVRILADGIYLQLGQLDMASCNGKTLKERALSTKRHRLIAADKLLQQSNDNNSRHDMGYFQRLTATIVDNLEVQLSNVHIRFEDNWNNNDLSTASSQSSSSSSSSSSRSIFAFGVILDSFVLKTTNSKWEEAFVAKTNQQEKNPAVHKLASLENLGIYHNCKSIELANLELTEWKIKMQNLQILMK